MSKICFLLIFLILPFLVYAQNIPQATGWVNDFAGVISPEYKEKLNSLIEELEQKTAAEIAVVTIDSISPYGEIEYARLLFDNWKPGKKGKDNGVLVLLAVKERRWRIETGYGIEGILPDGLCGEIGRNYMVPYFKEGKYGEGLYYGVASIANIISKDAKTEISGLDAVRFKKQDGEAPVFLYLFALAVLVILGYIASLVTRYNYWDKLPAKKRRSFFGPQNYGRTSSGGYGGDWGGGFGGGGFGGGSGGGGGAGGGF